MILSSYFIHFLCVLTKVENTLGIRPHLFKKIKVFLLKQLLDKDPYFINNDVSNILCMRANHSNNFNKSLCKILDKPLSELFRVSPRAMVSCVLNDNIEMLKYIQNRGYPLEMIVYANNFGLLQKRKRMHILQELSVDV